MNKKGFSLSKEKLNLLFDALKISSDEIIAPVKIKGDNFLRMQPVNSIDEVYFKGISWFTSKKYVFPETQELFAFKGEKIKTWNEKPKKRVLFGLRQCDLNAFYINDYLFLNEDPPMKFYKTFRENLTLVGLWCDKPQDEYCFCDSIKLKHKYDLCLFDRGKNWHIKSESKKGDIILLEMSLQTEHYTPSQPNCKRKLHTHDIKNLFEKDEIWQKGTKDCLSCGDCTTLCPTCLCFDIEDKADLSLKCGSRCAKWDSCMYKDFTLVAGEHVFRDKRVDRFKHRIFHKIQYFREQFGELMCTGCGRCTRGCPTKIDWVKLINSNAS